MTLFNLNGTFYCKSNNLFQLQNQFGKYEYRFLFVEVHDLLQTTIVIEDNRQSSLPTIA